MVSYLNDQHTHGDGSQQVFVVIQPLLHFVIAALETHNQFRLGLHNISEINSYHGITCVIHILQRLPELMNGVQLYTTHSSSACQYI